ncbi:MAG: DUF3109 family protein [Odoribacteraceae bacterium]|jgi:hypothetical protein|nr:DUF3109 family protein [Odoribacteraceae bacterium]
MIQVGNALVSAEVITRHFRCDPAACHGICCVAGDAGAPLEEGECREIEESYAAVAPYMKPAGVEAVERQGFSVIDADGDEVTPLIDGAECAYAIDEGGCCWCAFEKAWSAGACGFRKPLSCHLYPVRVARYRCHEAVNYDRWRICDPARARGEREGMPVYLFLREALVRRFGEEWFQQLRVAADALERGLIHA